MELNYLAILFATIAQFVCGGIWYTFVFGQLWGRMHGFDKLPKATQEKMAKAMGPYYGIQLFLTVVTSVVLYVLINIIPGTSSYLIALLLWFGFVVPTQVSAVIFGGTEGKWVVKKILVMASASLLCLLSAVAVIGLFN